MGNRPEITREQREAWREDGENDLDGSGLDVAGIRYTRIQTLLDALEAAEVDLVDSDGLGVEFWKREIRRMNKAWTAERTAGAEARESLARVEKLAAELDAEIADKIRAAIRGEK